MLTNADNDFTGTVAIDGGTLEVVDDALPDLSTVTVANDATLLFTIDDDTTFMGTITGEGGSLVKEGDGIFTLGGDVALGDLAINGGKLAVGTGTSTNPSPSIRPSSAKTQRSMWPRERR